MRIVVYASEAELPRLSTGFERALPSDAALEILPFSSFGRSYKKKAPGALVYIDAAGQGPERLCELGSHLAEIQSCAWGIIDRGGELADPAALFFEGASDYLGPQAFRGSHVLSAGRLSAALVFAGLSSSIPEHRPPFPGWNSIKDGAEVEVRFCYASIASQKELIERIGEKRLHKLREDFASFLGPWAAESGGIVWIKEPAGCLALFPPSDEGMNPILSAFRILIDRILVGFEVFHLETPLNFRFAFHEGKTMWRPPGSTGSVVSEDVNFIFHLGSKGTPDGMILVSGESEASIPPYLRDLFAPAGDFEGHQVFSSKRFRD